MKLKGYSQSNWMPSWSNLFPAVPSILLISLRPSPHCSHIRLVKPAQTFCLLHPGIPFPTLLHYSFCWALCTVLDSKHLTCGCISVICSLGCHLTSVPSALITWNLLCGTVEFCHCKPRPLFGFC